MHTQNRPFSEKNLKKNFFDLENCPKNAKKPPASP